MCIRLTFLTANYTTFVSSWFLWICLYLYLSSSFIFTCHVSLWLSSCSEGYSGSDWSVTYSCAIYTCRMKAVCVCVYTKHHCTNRITTMFTHNAFGHSCTVWSQCICPQCSSDESDLRSADSFYVTLQFILTFFIACTVFSLFYVPLIILTLVYDLCFLVSKQHHSRERFKLITWKCSRFVTGSH